MHVHQRFPIGDDKQAATFERCFLKHPQSFCSPERVGGFAEPSLFFSRRSRYLQARCKVSGFTRQRPQDLLGGQSPDLIPLFLL